MDLGNLNPQDLMKYLQNIDWPATKNKIIDEVQNNDAPGDIVDQLKNKLSDGEYQGPEEVISNVQQG